MTSKNSSTTAAAAAAMRILGFYDSIPATDKKAFTAGLVEILSTYPPAVVERAVSPSRGLPAYVSYPNLAKFKELLDEWVAIHWDEQAQRAARLPKPEVVRLAPGRMEEPPQGHFGNVHIPADSPRHASFVEWSKTADPKFWKFGKSSVGVDGIWIPLDVWDEGETTMKKIATSAVITIDQLRGYYATHGLGGKPKPAVDDDWMQERML